MDTLHTLSKYAKMILLWGVIFALVAGIGSLIWPKQYSATSQLLLISRDRTGVDPYTQAKSAERIGENLAEVLKTTDFYSKVFELSTATFDKTRWQNLTERNQRKQWQKDVQANMIYNTSLLSVSAYSKTQDDAVALSQAVTETLVNRGWEYVGGDVSLKVVNAPLVSRLPARPNILLNIALGFALGILLSGLWVANYKHGNLFN